MRPLLMLCGLVNWIHAGSPVPCKNYFSGVSGHMFNNVPEGDHTVVVIDVLVQMG